MGFDNLPTILIPSATDGPIPKAKITVPSPITSPNNLSILLSRQIDPKITTLISIAVRIEYIGRLLIFCKPIIKPSLGPAPRFDIK